MYSLRHDSSRFGRSEGKKLIARLIKFGPRVFFFVVVFFLLHQRQFVVRNAAQLTSQKEKAAGFCGSVLGLLTFTFTDVPVWLNGCYT